MGMFKHVLVHLCGYLTMKALWTYSGARAKTDFMYFLILIARAIQKLWQRHNSWADESYLQIQDATRTISYLDMSAKKLKSKAKDKGFH